VSVKLKSAFGKRQEIAADMFSASLKFEYGVESHRSKLFKTFRN
jgi:hypothetical protein